MEYRNTKTGVVISANAVMAGNWEPIDKAEKAPAPAEPKKDTAPKRKGTAKK